MLQSLKQFTLLTRKNLIVIRRSIVWTIVEFAIPLIIGLPISIMLFTERQHSVEHFNGTTFEPVTVYGSFLDRKGIMSYNNCWDWRYSNCQQKAFYSWKNGIDPSQVQTFMNSVANRFIDQSMRNRSSPVLFKQFDSIDAMAKQLEKPSNYQEDDYSTSRVGIVFTKFDINSAELSFELYLSRDDLGLDKEWRDNRPYGERYSNPAEYLSYVPYNVFEHAINSEFVKLTQDTTLPPVTFLGMPTAGKTIADWMSTLAFMNLVMGMIILPIVIHTSREIAAEKEAGVKDFLSVMGLGPSIFYASHIFIGWLKGAIVLTIVSIRPIVRINAEWGHVNAFIYLLAIWLYILAAMCFAAMIASLFQTSNSAIKVSILVHVVSIGLFEIPPVSPSFLQNGLCFLAALNYNSALGYVFASLRDYLYRNREVSFSTFFEDSAHYFNLGPAMCMLLVDIVWMLTVTAIADTIYSKTDFSVWNLFTGLFKKAKIADIGKGEHAEYLENSQETRVVTTPADIQVDNLTKIWGSTGERAVDGMNLKAHRGEVTVLLGHNGAGKSTTFSVICGLTPPTSGKVQVETQSVGLCPQGNALFEKLTVNEHLWFYHQIKGATNDWKAEGHELMEALELLPKKDTRSMALSGGMKRKLCLLMALIGDSRVVLLDEPTAGMDTGARSDVKKMLEVAKKDRTILLTTHYMDEAEALGDTITIMVKGKNVAGGSAQFLKKRFGTGYILTAVVAENSEPTAEIGAQVLQVTTKFVPSATIQNMHGRQLELVLPTEEQNNFPQLFGALEMHREKLGISSFGVSLNTLEQVFLRVGELADHHDDGANARKQMFDETLDRRRKGIAKVPFQLISLLRKRVLYGVRNWPQWLYQIILPVAIAFIFATTVHLDSSSGDTAGSASSKVRTMDLHSLGYMRVPVVKGEGEMYTKILDQINKAKNLEVVDIPAAGALSTIQNMPRRMPAMGLGFIFDGNDFTTLVNTVAYHPSPVFLNVFANIHLKSGSITNGLRSFKVKTSSEENGADSGDSQVEAQILDYFVAAICVIVFSLLTSAFSIFIVVERMTKFAHQQSLTAVSPIIYWMSSVLYDLLIFAITTGLVLIAFVVGKWDAGQMPRIILSFAVYFYAAMPMVYIASFWHKSPSKANTILVIWQTVGAMGALLVIEIISTVLNVTADIDIIVDVVAFLFPPYSMAMSLINARKIGRSSSSDTSGSGTYDTAVKNYYTKLVLMVIFGTIMIIIFILSRSRMVRLALTKCFSKKVVTEPLSDDVDLVHEREYVQKNHKQFVLEVDDLSKSYGKFTALDRLTFGVKPQECFGLLGVNGAGKTTTFGILTGELFQSKGNAYICRKTVNGTVPIGYCPQFDAMLPDLTGRETLEILATLYGYSNAKRKADSILRAVLMEQHGDKLVKHYSGGQKRKVSVGIALLAQSELIILDEPTAGIDPKARREIWSLLCSVRDHENSSLLLTSHSMDECEALCTKIAILVKGRMVAVGTSQHLKTRFSNSYLLTVILPETLDDSSIQMAQVRHEVQSTFAGSTERVDFTNGNIMKFTIPKHGDDRWSDLWERAKRVADSTGCTDYSITQSTLTETFLNLNRGTEGEVL